jgi:hypothetical protein
MTRNLKVLGVAMAAVFAMSALAASAAYGAAADFKVAEEGKEVAGTLNTSAKSAFQTFTTSTGKITCATPGGTASLTGQSGEITAENLSFTNCHATALKLPATVDPNGCKFRFTAGTFNGALPGSEGSVHLEGCEEGKGITVTIFSGSDEPANLGCTIHVTEQTLNGISYVNGTNAATGKEDVTIKAAVKGEIKALFTAGPKNLCVNEHTETAGNYEGEVTVTATNNKGNAIDATVVST